VNSNRIGHSPFDWGQFALRSTKLSARRNSTGRSGVEISANQVLLVQGLPPDSDYRFKLPFYAAMPAPSKGRSLISPAMR